MCATTDLAINAIVFCGRCTWQLHEINVRRAEKDNVESREKEEKQAHRDWHTVLVEQLKKKHRLCTMNHTKTLYLESCRVSANLQTQWTCCEKLTPRRNRHH